MKIILSPAKTMSLDKPFNNNWRPKAESKDIIVELLSQSSSEIEKNLKVEGKLLQENLAYIENFKKKVSYPAIHLYKGLTYRSIGLEKLDQEALDYLDKHLKILSALYGPIGPLEPIKPYRLDMSMPLKIRGQNLRKHWEGSYGRSFKEGEAILNLASQEFSSLLNKENYKWIDFDFQVEKQGKINRHGSILKKARGAMVHYMAKRKIKDLEEVKSFDLDGYRYIEKESEENCLVFRKEA